MNDAPVPLSRRRLLQAGAVGLALTPVLGSRRSAAANPLERSRVQAAARTLSLNTDWRFGGVYVAGSAEPSFDDRRFARVTVPHTVTELSWRRWDPASWEREWIYRRHFDVPQDLAGLRLFVDFGAALTAARVALNGEQLGTHFGGYLPFGHEITDRTTAGDNVLAVALDAGFDVNVPPNRPGESTTSVDFWQPGGLYRDIALRAVPQVFLSDVFAKPVDVLRSGRSVQVECTVDSAVAADARVEVTLRDGDRTLAKSEASARVEPGATATVELTLDELGDITLWGLGEPRLYDVVATLHVGGRAVHDYTTRIGFRDARFTADGFYLNGERLQLFGVNRHQFYPFAGASLPARVQRRDVEIMLDQLNCNMVRTSHYPQAESFFDACDELGLLAFEEIPGWGLYRGDAQWNERVVQNVQDMVVRDRNHPSIVTWGVQPNETFDDVELFTRTRDLAHRLDDSRQTTGAIIGGMHGTTRFVQDVFSYNDYARTDGHAGLMPPRTDRPYLVSEAVGTLSGPAIYYRRTDPVEDQQGQAIAHAWVHEIAASDKRYCGLLSWSGFDYPSGTGNQFEGVKYTGVVDLFRELKPGAAIYQSQLDPSVRPVIQPAFYWDFGPDSPDGGPGRQAMICSNCERLDVYVGGERVAQVEPDRNRFGHLSYPPSFVDLDAVDGDSLPELRIDGFVGGKRVATRSFSSDPARDDLAVSADDTSIRADGTDATRVVFRVLDRYGAARPYPGGEVEIALKGPGELVGDSPFAFADAGGVGAVWIRSVSNNPGTVSVHVKHAGYGSRTVSITSRNVPPPGPPAANADLSVISAPALVPAGETARITATLFNHSSPELRDVTTALEIPSSWNPEPVTPTSFAAVSAGQSVRSTWEVVAPRDAKPAPVPASATATYVAAGVDGADRAPADLVVPSSVEAARDNAGISDDSDVSTADFDGARNSYSRQALADAGLTPGAVITHGGVRFVWPDTAAGSPDNILCDGQALSLSGTGSKLGILGATSGGSLSGVATIQYADGSTSESAMALDDWFFEPTYGSEIVVEMSYLNADNSRADNGQGGKRTHRAFVFYTTLPVRAGAPVVGVTLARVGSSVAGQVPAMHVFALGVG